MSDETEYWACNGSEGLILCRKRQSSFYNKGNWAFLHTVLCTPYLRKVNAYRMRSDTAKC